MSTVVPVELPDAALAADVVEGLALVEDGLRRGRRRPSTTLLAEASRHLIDAGGKRFRATLVLLAAQFGDPRDERIVPAAVAIELTHLATLYHDDVMDEAAIRRGLAERELPLGQHRRDPDRRLPVRPGLADPGRPGPGGDQDPGRDLHPAGQRSDRRDRRARARARIRSTTTWAWSTEKTASLIATVGRFGAMFSGAPQSVVDRITPACEALGIAYQLSDDILDVASESAQSGKTPGTDLREGVRTLPMLHALRSAAAR